MNRNNELQCTNDIHMINCHDQILVHEHIFNKFPYWMQTSMENFVLSELNKAYLKGITVICDLTAYTKPYNYYEIIEKSPIKLVSCIGFYTPKYISAQQRNASFLELTNSLSKQIEKGIGRKQIKPGILKIAAQGDNLSALETKLFKVIALLSKEYNLPIALHAPKGAYHHTKILLNEGVSPEKLFVAHIENGISNTEIYDSKILEAKAIIQEGSWIQLADFGCSSTTKKAKINFQFAADLIYNGYLSKMLLSGDTCWRCKNQQFLLKDYNHGGKSYSYTKEYIIPILQTIMNKENLEQIFLHDNPQNFFQN